MNFSSQGFLTPHKTYITGKNKLSNLVSRFDLQYNMKLLGGTEWDVP